MNPVWGIAGVLGLFGGLMLTVRWLQSRGVVEAEVARKLVHMGMGAVCLAFPWIFAERWPVWGLAVASAGLVIAVRRVTALRERFGGVLGGVERVTLGEVYFPFAVAIVFTLADGDRAAFCVPVAILAFADAAGALVGARWGRIRYTAVESTKSIEGSIAVFAVTWLCAASGLVALAEARAEWALLAGAVIALFAALVEAVSWRGLDNLTLPLVAFAQMKSLPALGASELAMRAAVMLLLTAFLLNWRRQLLDSSARLGAALAIYFFWSVGDWRWLVAPVVVLVSYARWMPAIPGGPPRHNLMAVLCVASAGVVWAVANARSPSVTWLWLYTLGFAAQQAIIAAVRFSQGRPDWARARWWMVATAQSTVLHGLAFFLVNGIAGWPALPLAIGLAGPGIALAVFMIWEPRLQLPDDLNARWWRQGICTMIAPAIGWSALF